MYIEPARARGVRGGWIALGIVVFLLLVGARAIAGFALEYAWWQEMRQLPVWFAMLSYGTLPALLAAALAFAVLWIAHARGMRAANTRVSEHPTYGKLAALGLLLLSVLFAFAVIDSWTVVRFFGGRGVAIPAAAWRDPAFGHPLSFYLFELPFYSLLLRFVLGLTFIAAALYWLTARGWTVHQAVAGRDRSEGPISFDIRVLLGRESVFLRAIVGLFLVAVAARFFLDRYDMLLNEHGIMVGLDWLNENIGLPLQWAVIAAALVCAAAFWFGYRKLLLILPIVFALKLAIPALVATTYVKPNELSIERPYIQRHIEATRSAYGLDTRASEAEFPAKADAPVDVNKNRALFDNVRLWDWRAFHDTVSQIQPLRPYTFSDTDVDRYTIDGHLRQVLVSPRELDLAQLGDARSRWTNPHLVYTHGYGLVMAEANQITPNGLPVLFIRDAPPLISTPSLKLTRPQLYYGEITHEPVFVRTSQPEFDYPAGGDNKHTRYEGNGGFPIASLLTRLATTITYGDWNVLLTAQLSGDSRMMIHRNVRDRLQTLAGFVHWDADPYLVVSADGRLIWFVDGYLTTDAHPYSRETAIEGIGAFNYIRNSVKATIDAYTGDTRLYVFDPADPLVMSYRTLFPTLFEPESAMPADLRAHVRYPETMFRAQAEIYRTYHMRDPEAFYNRADVWDIARTVQQEGQAAAIPPAYLVATLPGETNPEFLLVLPFTPRNKDNIIGMMVARCDGASLGELRFLLLSKQEVIMGPMQVDARINQDQNISKDLTLWNQQGSTVLRGSMTVLPVDNTFVYVEPIYIQAKEARMPQMKKVAVVAGNNLIYTDTYAEALAQLGGTPLRQQPAPEATQSAAAASESAPAASQPPATNDRRVTEIGAHLRRYRELVSQGRLSDAGRELEAIQAIVDRK